MSQHAMMRRFVCAAPSTPSTPSTSGARSVHHAAAARRLFVPPELPAPSPQATPTPSGISSQVSEASEVAEDSDDFVVNFSRVYYNGERLEAHRLSYGVTHKSQLAGKRKLSLVWQYGVKITYVSPDRGERTFWLCKRCHLDCPHDALKAIDGYKHVHKHMAKKHRIDVATGLLPEADKPVYSSPFAAAKVAGSNRLLSHTPWEEKELQAALIDWVILRDVSFNIATSTELRGLLTWNRTSLLKALPSSVSTITSYVRSTHALRMSEIKALLKTASSRLSISIDVWTSSNYLSFLGVVAHFSDSQYKQRDVLIAFRNLYSDHTGAAQAVIILNVLNKFNVAPRLQAFVGDNASNNDSELIKGLNQHPDINLSSSNRIRCAGHIINLVVKATLYGKGVGQFENNLAEASPAQQYELFRSQGVVGKLHNFVNAVCASHKRRELFQSVQKELRDDDDALYTYNTLQLRQDGGVRWHSVYYMLLRCLELRRCIQRFMTRSQSPSQQVDDDYDPLTDTLTEEEWEAVQQLVDFLQLPVEMTKRLEGSNSVSGFGSLWQTLTNLQTLWTHYNSEKVRCESPNNSSSAYFVAAVVYGEQKLNTYFNMLVVGLDVSYYCVATALHPALRLAWFQTHWKPYNSWVKAAEASVKKVYNEYLAAELDNEEPELPLPSRRKAPNSDDDNLYSQTMAVDIHYLTGNKARKRQKRSTQLEEYFDDLRDDLTVASDLQRQLLHDPWLWWLQVGRNKYPIVFKMATDILSIPATSCECERCFSTAKRTITDDRNRLNASTIEALQLQKNWLRNDVVNSDLLELDRYIKSLDTGDSSSAGNSNSETVGNSGDSRDYSDDVG